MKISVDQITESPKDLKFSESMEDLNQIYAEGEVKDFRFPSSLEVDLVYYRSGRDLYFQGQLGGTIEGCCGRCLKNYRFALEKNFDFVLIPEPASTKNGELSRDELGLSFYRAEEINLAPYIKEQVLLGLPTRPLCGDTCRGLCVGCGADLNEEPCVCASSAADPRMTPFRNLKLGQ